MTFPEEWQRSNEFRRLNTHLASEGRWHVTQQHTIKQGPIYLNILHFTSKVVIHYISTVWMEKGAVLFSSWL